MGEEVKVWDREAGSLWAEGEALEQTGGFPGMWECWSLGSHNPPLKYLKVLSRKEAQSGSERQLHLERSLGASLLLDAGVYRAFGMC